MSNGKSAGVQAVKVSEVKQSPIKSKKVKETLKLNPMVFRYYLADNFLKDNELHAVNLIFEEGKVSPIPSTRELTATPSTIQVDYQKTKDIYVEGLFLLKYKGCTYVVSLESRSGYFEVFSADKNGIKVFRDNYENYRIKNNMYKGKTFRIDEYMTFLRPKESDYQDLVLDEVTKQTAFDQSVFFLEKMKGMNGVILFGEPGTGKSYTSASIAYECLKRGITVISLYNLNVSSMIAIKQFIHTYCNQVLVCIEDIDSAGSSRESFNSSDTLAPLLEFMDGFESNSDISCVVFATTNYLDKLDKAIGNRPCRFNRKIEFKYLKHEQTVTILNRLFKNQVPEESMSFLKEKTTLTPSHLAEICRTANLMALKENSDKPEDYFMEASKEVLDTFSLTLSSKPIGFRDTPY